MIASTLSLLDRWQIATFVALLAAVIGLWRGPRFWWGLGVATVSGYIAGVLHGPAILWLAIAWLACEWYTRAPTGKEHVALTAGVSAVALLLGLHALPGFNNPIVIDHIRFTPDAEPFTLYLNFDKTVAGLLLLGVCHRERRGLTGLFRSLRRVAPFIAVIVSVLITASYCLDFVQFAPQWTPYFWVWATVNLFSVCLSEEAFFRGFVLRELQSALAAQHYGSWLALTVSAVLFGCAHFAGGWRYVLLSTLAGLGYGYIYQRTKRIECAMLAHFTLNATHFLLFTYPRLL